MSNVRVPASSSDQTLGYRLVVGRTALDREAVVRINDRGPFVNNRIIDLSLAAAKKLAITKNGTARVRLTVLNPNLVGEEVSSPSNYSVQIGI